MLEEAERPKSKVDNRRDYDQSHNPVTEVVQHRQARPDKELDEVVPGPRYNIRDLKPGSGRKACGSVSD